MTAWTTSSSALPNSTTTAAPSTSGGGPLADGGLPYAADWTNLGGDGEGLGRLVLVDDLDADGFSDVVAAGWYYLGDTLSLRWWRGTAAGLSGTPEGLWSGGDTPAGWGLAVADLDRSGAPELYSSAADAEGVGVVRGYPLDGSDPVDGRGVIDGVPWGTSIAALGDIDGDGYDDLAVGTGSGYADICFGGPTVDLVPDLSLAAPGFEATLVAGVGDVTGDGWPDLLIGGPSTTVGVDGAIGLYAGGPGGPSALPVWVADGPYDTTFGAEVFGLGDVTADGAPDFVIVSYRDGEGTVALYAGVPPPEPEDTATPIDTGPPTDTGGDSEPAPPAADTASPPADAEPDSGHGAPKGCGCGAGAPGGWWAAAAAAAVITRRARRDRRRLP